MLFAATHGRETHFGHNYPCKKWMQMYWMMTNLLVQNRILSAACLLWMQLRPLYGHVKKFKRLWGQLKPVWPTWVKDLNPGIPSDQTKHPTRGFDCCKRSGHNSIVWAGQQIGRTLIPNRFLETDQSHATGSRSEHVRPGQNHGG